MSDNNTNKTSMTWPIPDGHNEININLVIEVFCEMFWLLEWYQKVPCIVRAVIVTVQQKCVCS